MTRTVWLVRHPPVALAWQKRCYGRSDPPLSRNGMRQAREIAEKLARLRLDLVIHSGLRRTSSIAGLLARAGIPTMADPQWRERDFGDWEGRSWHAIYRETGNAMDGMMTRPESFRPGGGETTAELLARIERAWAALPSFARVAIISHGGPIACMQCIRAGAEAGALPQFIPPVGEIVPINL